MSLEEIEMTDIKVRITEEDKTTLFTGKTLSFGGQSIKTPYKNFDLNNYNKIGTVSSIDKKLLNTVSIIEKSQNVSEKTYKEISDNATSSFLKSYNSLKRTSLGEKIFVNTLTFNFNPFKVADSKEYLHSLLDIYHEQSDLLLIPNLKVMKDKKIIISSEYFKKYVNLAYESLSFKNSKPIFVPLPTEYGVKPFRELLSYFLLKGYRYFWMDFQSSNTMRKAPVIRAFHELVSKYQLKDETVFYGSNLQRELNPDKKEIECRASDILSAPFGLDIIGVNKERSFPFSKDAQKRETASIKNEEWVNHKARILNRTDYMYVQYASHNNVEEILDNYKIDIYDLQHNPKFYSNLINTFEMNKEFDIQRAVVDKSQALNGYLINKKAIDSKIIKSISKDKASETQRTVNDFF